MAWASCAAASLRLERGDEWIIVRQNTSNAKHKKITEHEHCPNSERAQRADRIRMHRSSRELVNQYCQILPVK